MANENLVGHQLGKYEVRAAIGRGGMGTIYLGYDPALDRQVAIKVLAPHLVFNTEFVERFIREARSAARLHHPNIVTIYDVGQEEGRYYFVMNYLIGQNLEKRIRQHGSLAHDEVLSILTQVAEALDYAHHCGLVHRDIKPANIVVETDNHITLTDFGIARATQESKLTSTGTLVGTPDYMAPEQAAGLGSDYRSDLYSLSVVAYQMFTGNVPFHAESTLALLYKIVHEPPMPIRTIRPDLPAAMEQVMTKALAKNPADRYASASDFVQALQTALAGENNKSVIARLAGALATGKPTPEPVHRKVTPPPSVSTVVSAPTEVATPTPTPVRQRSGALPWLWIIGGAAAVVVLTVIVLVTLLVLGVKNLKTMTVSNTATPSITFTNTPGPTQTLPPTRPAIQLTEFSHPSGLFRVAYPSTWQSTTVSETGSLSPAFEWADKPDLEQVWVMAAGTVEAAAALAEQQAGRFENQSQYVLLRNDRSAGGILREARYTDPQRGEVHLMLLAQAQGRAVGLVVFMVSESSWADYAPTAQAVLTSFTVDESAVMRALATPTPRATMTVTATLTFTATATSYPTRVRPTSTPVPPTATLAPTATEKPEKNKSGGGGPPPP